MAELHGRILFTSGKDGDTDLWCLDVGAGALRQLTFGTWRNYPDSHFGTETYPDWTR